MPNPSLMLHARLHKIAAPERLPLWRARLPVRLRRAQQLARLGMRIVVRSLIWLVLLLSSMVLAAPRSAPGQPGAPAAGAAAQPQPSLILAPATAPPGPGLGSVQFIGTATVLLRYRGLTILTDPNFLHKGDHVHLGYGLQAQRLTDPAMELGALPPLDLVILSHLHEDHFDKLVQQQLPRATPIVTTGEAGDGLRRLGFTKVYTLARWATLDVSKGDERLRITAMPGRHGPPVLAGLLPDVMGTMLDFSSAQGRSYRTYISGDTLVFDDIAEIPRRFPDVDLALLHLGGTRILGVLKVTMDGHDGVDMLRIIAPKRAIPIHYNDYDVFKSPLSDFTEQVAKAGWQDRVTYLKHGELYQFSP